MRTTRSDEFEQFVRDHRGPLVRFATTLTAGDAHLAEDLVQAALVRVYLANPARAGDLRAYVRRAVVNGLIDHTRRPFFRRERPERDLPDRAATDSAVTARDGVDPALIAALAALPVRMRAAVVLRHVEGMSVDEAATALGCSTGNVKSQTARGLDKLRDLLAARPTGAGDHAGPDDHHSDRTPVTTPRASGAGEGEDPCRTS